MNNYQKVVVLIAAVNTGLMLLFPPALDVPLVRGMLPSFDGFHPFWELVRGRRLFTDLLTLQVLFVGANALAAWVVLQGPGRISERRYSIGILIFVLVDLGVVLLFPPFQTYSSLSRYTLPGFDGFYFAFGERSRRALFMPVLYLEVILVVANALIAWVILGLVRHAGPAGEAELLAMAAKLDPDEMLKLSEDLRRRAVGAHAPAAPDRRAGEERGYRGSERRNGDERRKRPR